MTEDWVLIVTGEVTDITYSIDMSLSKLQEMVKTGKAGVLRFMGLQRVRRD